MVLNTLKKFKKTAQFPRPSFAAAKKGQFLECNDKSLFCKNFYQKCKKVAFF